MSRVEGHLSATQLTTYLGCARRYYMGYVLKLPWPAVPSALVYGSAIHAALAALHEARLEGRTPEMADLMDVYQLAWVAEQKTIEFRDGETLEGLNAMARAMLALAIEQAPPGRVLCVEERFSISVGDNLPPLVGVLDLVVEIDGKAVIYEHKTAARRWTPDQANDSLQASAYAAASIEMGLPGIHAAADVEIRFGVFTKTQKPALTVLPTRRSERDIDELRETAAEIWRAKEAGIFPRNRSWQCRSCPFFDPCSR